MALQQKGMHGTWASRWTFIMAATGSAVGLGNMWKFPYVAGSNGGGAFVLIYLGCILLIGVPVMMAEVLIGRHGRQSPINSMNEAVADSNANSTWRSVGWLGVATVPTVDAMVEQEVEEEMVKQLFAETDVLVVEFC